ncbi:protein kinase [Angomonas deanei]|uniref:Protein kinase domain containing protein, putative n=1 Tax=Angomonas deanei TaxID=59799 RepID=A0A7G2C6G6_9TRYP|nr:protein kinase [Angomonas deanei]CAD2215356.1 Protein kinase domain containing protein, putative [Angomonas deanei]|eukprot:EPY20378.1 protein kinase [Angomonas deanei]
MCELITTKPLFPGSNEVDQLFKIMNVLGSPTEKIWAGGMSLAKKIRYSFPNVQGCGLAKALPPHIPPAALELIEQMLTYDPKKRPTAEQCLQHPYFNVGIDDGDGLSVAAMDQLANAARRLQQSPQSAPAAMQNTSDTTMASDRADKPPSTVETKRSSLGDFSTASPKKLYNAGGKTNGTTGPIYSPKKNLFSPSKMNSLNDYGTSTNAPVKQNPTTTLGGLNLANVKTNNILKNTTLSTVPDKPTPAVEKKSDLDLDGLMDEFATELENDGLSPQKEILPSGGLANVKNSSEPVASMLANIRYKKDAGAKAPPLSLKNVKQTSLQNRGGVSNAQQAVSPSIKALLAKYRV